MVRMPLPALLSPQPLQPLTWDQDQPKIWDLDLTGAPGQGSQCSPLAPWLVTEMGLGSLEDQ